MKTKQHIETKISTLTSEISDLETQSTAAYSQSDWAKAAIINSEINIKFGQRLAYQDCLFYVNFNQEMA